MRGAARTGRSTISARAYRGARAASSRSRPGRSPPHRGPGRPRERPRLTTPNTSSLSRPLPSWLSSPSQARSRQASTTKKPPATPPPRLEWCPSRTSLKAAIKGPVDSGRPCRTSAPQVKGRSARRGQASTARRPPHAPVPGVRGRHPSRTPCDGRAARAPWAGIQGSVYSGRPWQVPVPRAAPRRAAPCRAVPRRAPCRAAVPCRAPCRASRAGVRGAPVPVPVPAPVAGACAAPVAAPVPCPWWASVVSVRGGCLWRVSVAGVEGRYRRWALRAGLRFVGWLGGRFGVAGEQSARCSALPPTPAVSARTGRPHTTEGESRHACCHIRRVR